MVISIMLLFISTDCHYSINTDTLRILTLKRFLKKALKKGFNY
jgi:hypothetical protein